MTKFDALKNYIARKGTFGWSDLSKHFGYRANSLNSYTTYLNSLRRAGFVAHTGRGQYKVLDATELRNTSGSEVMRIIRNQQLVERCYRAEKELRQAERENNKLLSHNLELEQKLTLMCNQYGATLDKYRSHWVFSVYRFFGGKL